MCRLFGQLSLSPADASDYLASEPRSLLKQSNARPQALQKDGWGLGYFSGGRPVIVKSAKPLYEEAARFSKLARGVRSKIIIGHIRAASNPRGLRSVYGPANTQPFTDGRLVFCHNGTLNIPHEVANFLGPYAKRIKGVNDSEVLFWQLVKFADSYGSIPEALKAVVREIWGVWEGCKGRAKGKTKPYTGLNLLVSDGTDLHALCHYPTAVGHRALFNPQAWGTMSLARRGGRVVVASEDLDRGAWKRLAEPELVTLSAREGRLEVRRERFAPKD